MTEPAPSFSRRKVIYDVYYSLRPNKPTFLPDNYPDLTGKTALVTGSNRGIGLHVCKLLYSKNCNVISVVRDKLKGEVARNEILNEYPDSKGTVEIVSGCDYLDLTLIKEVGTKIKEILKNRPLNIIIHNAGLVLAHNDKTASSKQEIEAMFQANVMGPQLLQSFLDPLFLKKDSDLKRIVWVSSLAHVMVPSEYGIHWDDLGFIKTEKHLRPSVMTLYGQSKAGNILQAHAWASKNQDIVDDINCVSVSCYPGNFNTNPTGYYSYLTSKIISMICYSTVHGAYSELYAALSPDLKRDHQGSYVVPFGEIQQPREDLQAAMKNGTDLKFWNLVDEMLSDYK